MKFTFLEKLILVVVIIMAIFFRTNHLEGKMTFEWDQSRDFTAVETMFKTGKPLLLGPIVRGDLGGFYLGPLYYYLVMPLYHYSGGNPLSLSVISIGMDALVIILLYSLLRDRLSWQAALVAIIIWAGSPLLVHDSFTPWNVSLISAWIIIFLTTLTQLRETGRFRYKFSAIFLAALVSNIHLSLVPVVLILLIVSFKSFLKLSVKQYLWLLLAFLLPLSTLIWHDLTHDLQNLRLLKQFILTVTDRSGGLYQITALVINKFGYTIGRLFTGEPYTYLGWIITFVASLYALVTKSSVPLVRLSLLTILAVIGSLIYYHDFDFAEYYFLPTYIPVIILCSILLDSLIKLLPHSLKYLLAGSLIVLYLWLGYQTRQEPVSPYSLTVKKEIIQTIKNLNYPVEVRTSLPRERNTGFTYLMKQLKVTSDVNTTRKAYIYESKNLEVISPPEARSIILDKPIQAFKLIVFSN
jgi:hypothetical protein